MWTSGDRRTLAFLLTLILGMFSQSLDTLQASQAGPRVSEFKLPNGLQVVVVPDHRAPVVTHYVWYRVGSADEPQGVSGIAHFLEHLMFKSTDKIASGEFSKIVSRMGGQDNAFTTHDVTGYFQRISKDRLPTVMEMEADRMVNLQLTEKEVATERDVIIEERRSRTENNPSSILVRADVGGALSEPSLSHPHHRLDARDGEAVARGRARPSTSASTRPTTPSSSSPATSPPTR